MSQVLSGLILTQLQKNNPDPLFVAQQKQIADAIAIAVQTYINENVIILNGVKPVAP